MKRLCLIVIVACAGFAQKPPGTLSSPQEPPPDIKPRREAIVKDDYKRNLADAATLARLAEELKTELESGNKYVVSVDSMKKAKEIEKLAGNIHARLKRY